MSISSIGRPDMGDATPLPGETNSTPLQQIIPAQQLVNDSTIMNLNSVANAYTDKKNYEGEASQPKLPPPVEGKTPLPIEPAVQNIVSGFIAKEITMLLADVSSPKDRTDLFNHLVRGTPLVNAKLSNKALQVQPIVEEHVQKEMRLENFTLKALYQPNKEAWIQTSVQPYSPAQREEIKNSFQSAKIEAFDNFIITEAELETTDIILLKAAVEGGPIDKSIKTLLKMVNDNAIEMTREKYGLPIGWRPETTDINKWKPINQGLINPKSVGQARSDLLSKNTDEVSQNYLDVIIDALYSQKEVLNEELLMNGELTLMTLDAKKANQLQKNELNTEQVEDIQKSNKRTQALGVFSKIMVVIGGAVSVLSMAVTIATAGLFSPLAVAAIAVTSAMLAFSVANGISSMVSGTSVTGYAFEALNSAMDSMLSGLSDAAAAAVKLAIIVSAVVVIAILIAASAPSAGKAVTGVARQALTATLAKTMLKQGLTMATRQIALQMSMMLLLGSGVLMELPAELLKLTDLSKTSQRVLQMLIFITVMLVVMAIAAAATYKITAGGSAPPETNPKINTNFTESVKNLGRNLKNEADETLTAVKKMLNDAMEAITHPINPLKKVKSAFGRIPTLISDLQRLQAEGQISIPLMGLDRFFKLFNISVSTVTSSVEMGYQSAIYKVYKDLSETEKAQAELQALIDSLDNAIRSFQEDSKSSGEMTADFGQAITAILNAVSASSNKLFNSLQA